MKKLKFLGLAVATTALFGLASCNEKEAEPTPDMPDTPEIPEETGHKVVFNTNGGSKIDDISVEDGYQIQMPENPIKEGAFFDGWYTDEALTTKFDAAAPISANLTVYAKWIESYTITFDLNNKAENITVNTDKEGKYTMPADPVITNHYFGGWYLDEYYMEEFDPKSDIVEDIVVYAKIVEKFTVSFNTLGNGEIASVETDVNSSFTKPVAPVKEGYVFEGWYLDESLTNKYDYNHPIKENTTLYAKFVEEYTITFDTEGGEAIEDLKYSSLNNVALPIANKDNMIFTYWVDEDNNEYNSLPKGTTGNISLKAVYKSAEVIDVTFASLANNIKKGYIANKEDGIYTLNCEVRGRIKVWTNPEDSTDTKTWDQSYKIGNADYFISFVAPGTGIASFYVQNGSSNALTQIVVVECSDGTTQEIEISGKNAVAPYPAGSPVVRVDLAVTKGQTYTIKRQTGTIDIFELDLECKALEAEVTGIQLDKPGTAKFVEGSKFDAKGLKISAIRGGYISAVDMDDVSIDTSNVNMYKPGSYDVKVNYGQYSVTYPIRVYSIETIHLGFNATYEDKNSYNGIFVNGKTQVVYELNEEFNPDYITTIVTTEFDYKFIADSNISYTGFDSKTPGEKEVTVTYVANCKSYVVKFKVYVVDSQAYKNQQNEYVVTVDKSYNGEIGAVDGENGNMFNTIGQALEFFEGTTIDQSLNKVLNIKAGHYYEKLEINVPNLTIIGAGATEATYNLDKKYNEDSYKSATIIEWDSLYGIKDESGYSQVTDSTATVAVRESAVNFTIKNVTLSNYWNCEEVFTMEYEYLEKEGIAVNDKVNDHRALALIVQSDKFTMEGCALLGYQDTVEFMTGRQFVYDTYISGNTDYIFGTNATTYFYKCEIFVNYKVGGSGYITAYKGCNVGASDAVEYGFVFDECTFTADSRVKANSFAIGRPWGTHSNVMVMNSVIGAHVGNTEDTRYVSMGGVNPSDSTVNYKEYNNTGDSIVTTSTNSYTIVDEATAKKHNDLSIIFGTTNGLVTYTDAWVPTLYNEVK